MMKKNVSIILLICVSLLACKKEILPPEQVVQGYFAYYDGSMLTTRFLLVHNGHIEFYNLRDKAVLANNCMWNFPGGVSLYDQGIYSIVDGKLLVNSGERLLNYGEIRVVGDTLHISGSKFLRVDKMTISPYTSINLSRYGMVFPFRATEDTLTVKLDRPLPNHGPISVKSSADWLRVNRIQNDVAYIKADALTSKDGPRSAKITFSYPYALDITVNVVQERIDEASLIRTLEAGVLSPTAVRLNAFLDVEDYPYTTIEKSFYYGTDCNNLNNVTSGGTLSGNVLSKQLQGLTCNTKYYYRAYLKLDDLEVWGEIKTFTTQDVAVSFDEYVSGIGWNNAIIGGRITATPQVHFGKTVTVYYGKAGTALFEKRMATIADDGSFTYLMSNLSSNTEYEWFIEADFAGGVFRSNTRTFKTNAVQADLTTKEATNITTSNVQLNCSLSIITENVKTSGVWFLYCQGDTNLEDLKNNGTKVNASSGKSDGTYSAGLKNLPSGTLYSYMACSRVGDTFIYGDVKTFRTEEVDATITTLNASNVEGTKARLNCLLTVNNADEQRKAVWFLYGENAMTPEMLMNSGTKQTAYLQSDGTYAANITELASGTAYYFMACSSVYDKEMYGEVKSFQTDVIPVESVLLDKTEYTFDAIGSTLTLIATVLPADATDKGVEWSSDNESVAIVNGGIVTAMGNGKATITAATKTHDRTASCFINVRQKVESITLDKSSLFLAIGESAAVSVSVVLPDNAYDKSYTWSSSDSSVASVDDDGKVVAKTGGKTTIIATANDGSGVFASCAVVVKNPCPEGAVDLGLSVYWATSNIGASKPEDYGDYYAWGEVKPKKNYSWSTYKWGTSSTTLTKYNTKSSYGTVDNKTVLDPEDDVAHVKLGGKWRMPTDEEWIELRTKCTWTWTDNYNGTGVKGRIVTATNGNSIFLPAAGYRNGPILYYAGSRGLYWSSSLYTGSPDSARYVYFNSDYVDRNTHSRYYGQSVRPVSE